MDKLPDPVILPLKTCLALPAHIMAVSFVIDAEDAPLSMSPPSVILPVPLNLRLFVDTIKGEFMIAVEVPIFAMVSGPVAFNVPPLST